MSDVGSYIEQLPFKGNLHIRSEDWSISYYFPGPDARYRGAHNSINGQDVAGLIEVLQTAWSELPSIAVSATQTTRVTRDYKYEVVTSASSTGNCVYLFSYRIAIRTEQELEELISSYRHALARVPKVQAFLRDLHGDAQQVASADGFAAR